MIVRTDQSLFSQSPSQFTENINGCFQCVASACVLWCLCFLEQQRTDLAMYMLSSRQFVSVFVRTCCYLTYIFPWDRVYPPSSETILTFSKPAQSMLIHSSTSAAAVSSDKAPRALRSAGGSAARRFLAVGSGAPTSWVMRGAEVPWGGQTRREMRDQIRSRGGRCVPKIWGGSVGGVSPVKLRFLFTPSAVSPHYWPLHCHFRSRCTLKDGGRLAGGGDRLGGEHKQGIIIHCIPRRSGPDWREQAGWKLFGAAWRLQREGTSRGNTSELSEWPVNTKQRKKKKTSVRWKVQPSFTVDWFHNRWR